MRAFISVIVPVGRHQTALPTVRSLLRQKRHLKQLEIILVGCHVEKLARLLDGSVRTVVLDRPENPAKTRAAGVKAAKGDFFLFVDDDIELDASFMARLFPLLERNNNIGALGARLPGKENKYFSRVTDLTNFWSQQSSRSGSRDWLYSAVLLVPADVYQEVGGFNPELSIGEDVELTGKVKQACYEVLYSAELIGHHNHGRTTFRTALAYFWSNGGLAKYMLLREKHIRVFSLGEIFRNWFVGLKLAIKTNRHNSDGLLIYLPGMVLMQFVFFLSLEWHYRTYRHKYIKESLNRENFFQHSFGNRFLRSSLYGRLNGKMFKSMVLGVLARYRLLFQLSLFVFPPLIILFINCK